MITEVINNIGLEKNCFRSDCYRCLPVLSSFYFLCFWSQMQIEPMHTKTSALYSYLSYRTSSIFADFHIHSSQNQCKYKNLCFNGSGLLLIPVFNAFFRYWCWPTLVWRVETGKYYIKVIVMDVLFLSFFCFVCCGIESLHVKESTKSAIFSFFLPSSIFSSFQNELLKIKGTSCIYSALFG